MVRKLVAMKMMSTCVDLRCDQKRTLSSKNLDIRIHHDIQLPQNSCCYVLEENAIPTLFHTCKKINDTHIKDEKIGIYFVNYTKLARLKVSNINYNS